MQIKATVPKTPSKRRIPFKEINDTGVYFDPDDDSYAVITGFNEDGEPLGLGVYRCLGDEYYGDELSGWEDYEVVETELELEIILK